MNLNEHDSNKIILSPKLLAAIIIQTITVIVIIMSSYGNVKQDLSIAKLKIEYQDKRLDQQDKRLDQQDRRINALERQIDKQEQEDDK